MQHQLNMARRQALQALSVFSFVPILGCSRNSQVASSDLDEDVMVDEPVDLPIPLLHRLHEIDDVIESRFPSDYDPGMGQLGLLLRSTLRWGGYWCTPENSLEFASTGGDGVHFSLVQINGSVTEESPVVMTVPANSGGAEHANAIVGSSLMNFLRFGLIRGYFAMEQLVYQRDLTLQAYSSADWQPTENDHFSVGFGVDDRKRKVLQLVADELKTTPLTYTPQEFNALQEQHMPLLRFKPIE